MQVQLTSVAMSRLPDQRGCVYCPNYKQCFPAAIHSNSLPQFSFFGFVVSICLYFPSTRTSWCSLDSTVSDYRLDDRDPIPVRGERFFP